MVVLSTPSSDTPIATPLTDDKARQILEGAREVFLTHGFDAASMNDIAKAAGVSKGTIYFHFESKEALFEAIIRAERDLQAEQCFKLDAENPDIRAVLTDLAHGLIGMMMRPDIVAQVRTVIAVAPKFPRIGRAFYETGPQHGAEELAAYFTRQTQEGRLNTPDARLAAVHYIQLCLGDLHKRQMFCPDEIIPPEEIAKTVAAGLDVFMRVYGVA